MANIMGPILSILSVLGYWASILDSFGYSGRLVNAFDFGLQIGCSMEIAVLRGLYLNPLGQDVGQCQRQTSHRVVAGHASYSVPTGHVQNFWVLFMGVLTIRAPRILFGLCIGAPDFWQLPKRVFGMQVMVYQQ